MSWSKELAGALRQRVTGAAGGTAVLMYHAVEYADGVNESEDYTVSATLFQRHLLALERVGATSLPLIRALAGGAWPAQETEGDSPDGPQVLLTFDDGFESVLTEAAERLGDAGFGAVVFITTDKIGTRGYLTPEQVKVLLGMGIVVGAHGKTHTYLTDLSLAALRNELETSRKVLEDLVGYPVTWMSAPGGRVDARVLSEARRAGFNTFFGSRPGLVSPLSDQAQWPLPRFSITQKTDPSRLERLVCGRTRALLSEQARFEALAVPKRVLGNAGYDAARKLVLDAVRHRRKGSE